MLLRTVTLACTSRPRWTRRTSSKNYCSGAPIPEFRIGYVRHFAEHTYIFNFVFTCCLNLQQGMTPLQIAVDRNFLAVAKLLRQAPTVYHHQTQAQALSSLGAYPFKDSDGLERYTEEITRQRMEEEAALIAQQQQQQQQPLYDIYNSSQIFLPPQPPSQQQPQPVAASPLTRSQSHTRLPMKQQVRRESSLEVLPQMTTKTVELDPQPNNVNADLATGQRVSRLQRAATEFDFRRSHRAPAPLPVAVAEPVLTANGVDLNRATAMPTASSKSVGERMDKLVKVKKEVEEKRYVYYLSYSIY